MIEDETLIDTNVLVYSFDNHEKEKHKIAKNLFLDIFSKNVEVFISIQNLSEFYNISTQKISSPLTKNEAREIVREIIKTKNFKILGFNEKTVLSAIDIQINYNSSYWDSLIAATMQENNICRIITENEKDFKKIPWIKIINPFKK